MHEGEEQNCPDLERAEENNNDFKIEMDYFSLNVA